MLQARKQLVSIILSNKLIVSLYMFFYQTHKNCKLGKLSNTDGEDIYSSSFRNKILRLNKNFKLEK